MKSFLSMLLCIALIVLCFAGCKSVPVNQDNPESTTSTEENFAGSYSIDSAVAGTLPASAQKAFDEAEKPDGASYTPLACIGAQVVAGTNFCILASSAPVVPNAQSKLVAIYLYQPINEKATITDIVDFNLINYLEDKKVTKEVKELAGGWSIIEGGTFDSMPEAFEKSSKEAIKKYTSVRLEPLAILGTQVVAGTNYAVVCKGALPSGQANFYVAVLYAGVDGTNEIISTCPIYIPELRSDEG